MDHTRPHHPRGESTPLHTARVRRAELHDAMLVVERSVAMPASAHREAGEPIRHGKDPHAIDAWVRLVAASLRQLHADFREHIAITEGPDGLYAEILGADGRFRRAIDRLTAEHAEICAALDGLGQATATAITGDDAQRLKAATIGLLGQLDRHRRRGADLIHEAYQTDIGGET